MKLDLTFAPDKTIQAMVLQHYGSALYDKDRFTMITNSDLWCKPNGGLWCSVDGSTDSWAMWCKGNDFKISDLDTGFRLQFEPGASVCTVDAYWDLLSWPARPTRARFLSTYFDFELMVSNGVDAIYLTERGQLATRFSDGRNLYGWDCESVLILNKDAVHQIT